MRGALAAAGERFGDFLNQGVGAAEATRAPGWPLVLVSARPIFLWDGRPVSRVSFRRRLGGFCPTDRDREIQLLIQLVKKRHPLVCLRRTFFPGGVFALSTNFSILQYDILVRWIRRQIRLVKSSEKAVHAFLSGLALARLWNVWTEAYGLRGGKPGVCARLFSVAFTSRAGSRPRFFPVEEACSPRILRQDIALASAGAYSDLRGY